MKRTIVMLGVGVLFTVGSAFSQKCLEGDCKNGTGKFEYENKDTYAGSFKEGIPHGEGTMKYYQNDSEYTGTWVNGKKEGKGKLVLNGDVYTGDFVNDLREGQGSCEFFVGGKFTGTWKAGNPVKGLWEYADGNKIDGEFDEKGNQLSGTYFFADNLGSWTGKFEGKKMVGQGTFTDPNGNKYTGVFVDNKPGATLKIEYKSGGVYEGEVSGFARNGKGVFTDANDIVYDCMWQDNKKVGKGAVKFRKNGQVVATYEGPFNNDQMHTNAGETAKYTTGAFVYEGAYTNNERTGSGKMTYTKSGNVFEGNFVSGKPEGKGKMKYVGMGDYEGDFVDGKPNGKGTMLLTSGDKYEGEWKDGKMHGAGKYTFKAGTVQEGVWENGAKK